MSLLDEAIELKAKRVAKEARQANKGKLPVPSNLLDKLKDSLKKMETVFEMLYTYYGVNTELPEDEIIEIVLKNRESDPRFYEIDIGDPSADLVQIKEMASRDGGATLDPMYQAYAIKFVAYKLEIYFIPYRKSSRGFAITVIDTTVEDEEEARTFFARDIHKQFAVEIMSRYV